MVKINLQMFTYSYSTKRSLQRPVETRKHPFLQTMEFFPILACLDLDPQTQLIWDLILT